MAVYVDSARNPLGRMLMSHLLADSDAELHAMAGRLGLHREWFQDGSTPHYDLCQTKRRMALTLGAQEIDRCALVALIRRLRIA